LYIISLVSISFNSQIRFILRFEKESKKATNANKIIIDKREAKDNAREAKETKIKAKKIEANIKANAEIDAKAIAIAIATTTTTTTIDRKRLLKLRKQFACTYVNLVLEIASMLSNYLLLFNNSREYINNTLYNQKLIKLLN